MNKSKLPNNLDSLHTQEQFLREKAIEIIQSKPKMLIHLNVIERTMSLANIAREYSTEDEDLKVLQMLSIRLFNAFGASLKLVLSGYHQKGAMIMRDILETVFLMDLFNTDHTAIERWRNADKKQRKKEFSPVSVRKALDTRDGVDTKKRAKAYEMLSELASHPTMWTQNMLKAELDGDILTGPFMGNTILRQGLDELGRLAVQAGEVMDAFLPREWDPEDVRQSFSHIKSEWVNTFYK